MDAKQSDLSCSISNLMAMSLPVIISVLSGTLMYTMDRVLLAHYSLEAMNGAGFAHQVVDIFVLPFLSFAAISEAFVGQFNGARQFKKASDPIMQIAISLICGWVVVFPFAICSRSFFIPASVYSEGNPYFCIGMIMIPFQIINSSISAFFVGTRRPKVILTAVLTANILNLVLDWAFIFGVGPIPPMGAKGAAIASLIATITSAIILGALFFNHYNAQNYDTRHMNFDWVILKRNLYIGAPYALSEFIEMSIWVTVLLLLEHISMDAVTLQNVGVTIWVFLAFISEGLQKGVMSLASNCIGAGKDILIRRLVRSMMWITCIWAVVSAVPLLLYPDPLLGFAFNITEATLLKDYRVLLFLLWLSYIFLLLSFSCLGGILSSGGDTKFVTCVKISSIFSCVVIPVGAFVYFGELTALTSWWLCVFQQIFNGIFFYKRFKKGTWKHNMVN
ncbi:MAG: hypothetical protein LBQ43_03160 [Holosporales bacterium]|jgi:MATE family multidrug resistance protein|nr:hypothetical protein [Holosporales bacterium]